MGSKPPIKRQDPFTGSGAQEIDHELEAQLDARERHRCRQGGEERSKPGR